MMRSEIRGGFFTMCDAMFAFTFLFDLFGLGDVYIIKRYERTDNHDAKRNKYK